MCTLGEVLRVIKEKKGKSFTKLVLGAHCNNNFVYIILEILAAFIKYKLKSEIKQISVRRRSAEANRQPT